jgi:hypothetical protein
MYRTIKEASTVDEPIAAPKSKLRLTVAGDPQTAGGARGCRAHCDDP